MWLRRNVHRLGGYGRITVVEAPAAYGFPRVAEELRSSERNVVWVALDQQDDEDAERIDDKLATACAAAFNGPLFDRAVSYLDQVAVLRSHLEFLQPFTLI